MLSRANAFEALGLIGAQAPSRYVGSTGGGAPTSGTYRIGDWVIDRKYACIRVCTTAGTPGTWTTPRGATTVNSTASSATPAINVDTTDLFKITALAAAITSMTSGLTGTPVDGQRLVIRIKDNGTSRAITWGASFVSSGTATLLAATVISKTHTVSLMYDSVAAKWVCLAVDATGY